MSDVGKLVRFAMIALGNAVVDIESGRFPDEQREELANGLDQLSTALREPERAPTVVESERLSRNN